MTVAGLLIILSQYGGHFAAQHLGITARDD